MTEPDQRAEYDSPWKEAISYYFQPFMAFFFPTIHDGLDWNRGYEFLDKEFQQIVRDAETGRRDADKLVKVWQQNGEETWILIHIEVQSQTQTVFPERMYIYNSRIFDRYRHQVLSLAILADERESWRPDRYNYEIFGCRVLLQFPTVKLLDYSSETLEESENPFAIIVAAHRETQQTKNDPNSRCREKLRIAKSLYQRGYQRQDILELYRLIDWMMTLPEPIQQGFQTEIRRFEEENQMSFVTYIERQAHQEGLEQGAIRKSRELILKILNLRFASLPEELGNRLEQIQDDSILTRLFQEAAIAKSLDTFQELLDRQMPSNPDPDE